MAQVRPFKALRGVRDVVSRLSSLPYDVMDRQEAQEMIAAEPLSFLKVTRAEATLPDEVSDYDEKVYTQAAANLTQLIEAKALVQDKEECYYIYREQVGARIQIGIVACASVAEYRAGIIKKHELTRTEKEQDRVRHILAARAQTGPVFLTYKNRGEIDALVLKIISNSAPDYSFTSSDGVKHTLYVVSNRLAVGEITRLFAQVPALYIADGHHRCAAASRAAEELAEEGAGEKDYFLAVIFPDKMLSILDYNRVVRDLNGLTAEEFLAELSKTFVVTELLQSKKPATAHTFTMYLAGKWYSLKLKDSVDEQDPIASLDVTILTDKVLVPLLNIGDLRKDERIAFVGGIRGLGELKHKVDSKEYAVAFALYPTSMQQLLAVADKGLIMPPKSTWFEPKLRDGLFVHLI